MNKNIIIGVIASIIILGGIVWLANPTQQEKNQANMAASSSGILTAQEMSFDFGTISMAKGKVTHPFTVKNTGTEPVSIGRMYTSCMCTNALLKMGGNTYGPYGMEGHGFIPTINKNLNPGEEAIVEAIFDPAAHGPAGVGNIQRAVILENNTGKPFELQFTALVTP